MAARTNVAWGGVEVRDAMHQAHERRENILLRELNAEWGHAFQIRWDGRSWTARRWHTRTRPLAAPTAAGLIAALEDAWGER
jgi:hypothetical protein